MPRFLLILLLLLLLLLLLTPQASAQFPEPGRPVTVIVPYPPGGGSDISARALAPVLERELGVPVVIVNRPGATADRPGADRAGPAGRLHLVLRALALDHHPLPRPVAQRGFTRDSFTPLAMHVIDPGSIIVRADNPLRTLADLIAEARARPGALRVSDPGILSWEHLASLALQKQHGLSVNQIHYQGSAPAQLALLAGETDVALVAAGTAMAQSRAGATRTLALLDDQESAFLPGVPTAASQGTRIVTGSARGFVGPAGLPPTVGSTLAEALARAITGAEHQRKMQELGLPVRFMPPAEFSAYWSAEEAKLAPLVREVVGSGRAN
ncbi:tripartite tricarboxylate transporter substrate binding protein [Siccirubricoccus deserti]